MKKLLLIFLVFNSIQAQDRYFGNLYGSNNLTSNNKDLEIWNNFEIGRFDYYLKSIHKIEFEIGLSKKWQTSFYLNLEEASYFNKDKNEFESNQTSFSFSNAWKYNYRKTGIHSWGQAIYAEYYIKPGEFELEAKWILDRFFDKNYVALNLVTESEFEIEFDENNELEYEIEWKPELNIGYMRFHRNWGFGLESKIQNVHVENKLQHSSLFTGPTLSYRGNKWWLIANITPQVCKLNSIYENDKNLALTDQEKIHAGIIFAINL